MQTTISITQRAAARIRAVIDCDGRQLILRVSVAGGGCSGFQYKFDLVGSADAGDVIVERDHARIAIDSTSLAFLAGAEIDYVDDLAGAMFRVTNPNAVASCGCGTSFSV